MILIQALLVAGFTIFLFRVMANPNSYQLRAWTKILTIIFVVVAIVIVLFPEYSNSLARFVGVTRGADLLLYLLTLSFIYVIFNLYMQEKRLQKRIVLLARKLAIIEANEAQNSKKHDK